MVLKIRTQEGGGSLKKSKILADVLSTNRWPLITGVVETIIAIAIRLDELIMAGKHNIFSLLMCFYKLIMVGHVTYLKYGILLISRLGLLLAVRVRVS